jgi:hypothetical protein
MKTWILLVFCSVLMLHSAAGADTPAASQADSAVSTTAMPSGDAASASTGVAVAGGVSASLDISHWIREKRGEAIGFGVAFLAILAITCTMLVFAGRTLAPPYITKLSASFFFWLEMGYLVLLLLVAAFYLEIIPPKHAPQLVGDVLPIGVPWFGALGAVVISLEGIFAYGQKDWDPKYNYWHIGRPLFGAVLGIVAFFTYLLIIMSAGAYPPFISGGSAAPAAKDYIVYYVVAFLVGYREETFRELIRRVTDLILKPGSMTANTPAVTFKQAGVVIANWDFRTVTAPGSSNITIDIENTGKGVLKSPSVTLDSSTATGFKIANDMLTGSAELKPGEVKSIDVNFTTSTAGATSSGTLTVTGGNLPTPAKLAISGKG